MRGWIFCKLSETKANNNQEKQIEVLYQLINRSLVPILRDRYKIKRISILLIYDCYGWQPFKAQLAVKIFYCLDNEAHETHAPRVNNFLIINALWLLESVALASDCSAFNLCLTNYWNTNIRKSVILKSLTVYCYVQWPNNSNLKYSATICIFVSWKLQIQKNR